MFDQYLKSVPKIPFVNVSDRTIPAFGTMTLWALDKHGWFQALPGAAAHVREDFPDIHRADRLKDDLHDIVPGGGTSFQSGPPVVDAPHAQKSDDDPERVPSNGKLSFLGFAVEWATAFNLGNAVEPKKRGYCYQKLPAIGILEEHDVPIEWGNALTLKPNDFTLIPSGRYQTTKRTWQHSFLNGWPFISRVPNTKDLVVIGGINSFVQTSEAIYI
jgi:hypothetical protein